MAKPRNYRSSWSTSRTTAVNLVERFEEKYVPEPNSGCWLWIGNLESKGYGKFYIGGRPKKAHRISYELAKGPIPAGLEPDHKCRVRCCVNPDHLEAVTHRENMKRGVFPQSSRTHCPSGHPYDESNTYIKKGLRSCRACQALRMREARARLRIEGVLIHTIANGAS